MLVIDIAGSKLKTHLFVYHLINYNQPLVKCINLQINFAHLTCTKSKCLRFISISFKLQCIVHVYIFQTPTIILAIAYSRYRAIQLSISTFRIFMLARLLPVRPHIPRCAACMHACNEVALSISQRTASTA